MSTRFGAERFTRSNADGHPTVSHPAAAATAGAAATTELAEVEQRIVSNDA